jgi:uncharacterized C2H2 Zn-finger protein
MRIRRTRAISNEDHYHAKTCPRCSKRFLGRGSEWCAPFYCSIQCRTDARNQRRAEKRAYARQRSAVLRKCAQCGRLFKPQRETARFCSTACRVAAHRFTGRIKA